MKQHTNISDYFDALCASFLNDIKKNHTAKKESVHDLRVDIKNIRAILSLGMLLNKNIPGQQILKQVKPLYKSAGNQRTLQINISLLKKYNLNKAYRDQFEADLKQTTHKFKKEIKSFKIKKFKKSCSNCVSFFKKIKEENVGNKALDYMHHILLSCKKEINKKNVSDAKLHHIRKELKLVKTNLQLLIQTNTSHKVYKGMLAQIIDAETLIGKWHDNAVFYDMLIQMENNQLINKKTLGALSQLKSENNLLKRDVISTLRDYLK